MGWWSKLKKAVSKAAHYVANVGKKWFDDTLSKVGNFLQGYAVYLVGHVLLGISMDELQAQNLTGLLRMLLTAKGIGDAALNLLNGYVNGLVGGFKLLGAAATALNLMSRGKLTWKGAAALALSAGLIGGGVFYYLAYPLVGEPPSSIPTATPILKHATATPNQSGSSQVTPCPTPTISVTPSPTPTLTPTTTPTATPTAKADTTTTLQLSSYNVSRGFSLTITATVSAASGAPSGTVTYFVDGQQVGQAPVGQGISLTSTAVTALSVGTHTATASYSGDSSFNPSQGSISFDVNNGV